MESMETLRFKKPERRKLMMKHLSKWGLPLLFLVVGLVLGGAASKFHSAYAASDTPILKQGSYSYNLDDYNIFLFMNSSDIIEVFIDMVVFRSEAESRGIKVTDADIDKFIQENMVAPDGSNRYNQYLELFDKATIRRQIELQIISDKLEKAIREQVIKENNIKVTEDEARDYFLKNISDIHHPAMVEVSLLSTNTRDKCEKALKELEKGVDFNELSVKMSDIKELVSQKGYLGVASYRDLEQINKTLAETAFNLSEGEYSAIIRGEQNFHIVFVHKKVAEYAPTFENIKSELMDMILETKLKNPMSAAYNKILSSGYDSVNPMVQLLEPKNREAAKEDKVDDPSKPNNP